ncbi:MarR family transcriptional regulator [Hahella sp. CCB-MM4]|uniref:MarR family winged helix-turn-helix transcriptional regulator n=1 Tax=Hahella sp. (strain CCB-MM4) TaxID=1926491 RepID=UPI000B9A4AFB|nr:MarR family transcriptional regulator [Hahella sp. CCB-MM4]OZG74136.1 MarR family transcriptional regulator [Hahella sp. CCB-MM4]
MINTNIGESLHRLLHAYKRAMRRGHQQVGLNLAVSHIRSLKVINHYQKEKRENCTAQIIAARLQRDKAQITRVIKDLLAENLIEKHQHPEDRRSQILRLTDKGVETMKRIKEAERLAGICMAQGLKPDEVTEFMRLAEVMTDNLSPKTD